MTYTWDQLAGLSLPQGYFLEKCLAEDEGGALYLTTVGTGEPAAEEDAAQPAVVKLVAGHMAAAGQLTAWERLAALSHPNVLALLDCGRAGPLGPDAGHFLYAVFEYPDDHLESALEGDALSEADAGDVLKAVEAGLKFFHAHGLAHTSVDPRHIVAVGDRIKLSGDTVRLLGPDATESADWKALGALRARLLGGEESEVADAEPERMPEPIIASTLAPTVGPSRVAPVAAELPFEAPAPEVREEWPMDPPPSRRGLPLWGYVAVAGMLALVLIFAFGRKPGAVPVPPPAPYVPVKAEVPVEKPKPSINPTDPANWRVVAYTYRRRKDAESKVTQINAKYPGFVPEVFSPKGGGQPPYLVALGGRMTRTQARQLRSQALSKGMPSGTYVQNFSN